MSFVNYLTQINF